MVTGGDGERRRLSQPAQNMSRILQQGFHEDETLLFPACLHCSQLQHSLEERFNRRQGRANILLCLQSQVLVGFLPQRLFILARHCAGRQPFEESPQRPHRVLHF